VGTLIAIIVGLFLAGLTTFGLITVTNNASAANANQSNDVNVIYYGTSN